MHRCCAEGRRTVDRICDLATGRSDVIRADILLLTSKLPEAIASRLLKKRCGVLDNRIRCTAVTFEVSRRQ